MKITTIEYSLKNKGETFLSRKLESKKAILSGQIILDSGKTYNLYFEVAEEFKDILAKDASPFLAAALPLAMYKKEKLEIAGSVSKNLLRNTPGIMKILKSWNLGLRQTSIKTDLLESDSHKTKNVGCFFSGGADSLYTYLKNKNKINNLIFVHGFDINADNFKLYKKIEKNILKIAGTEKKKLIRVRTNIREIFDEYFDWEFYHPFAIAGVALFLRAGFKEIYLSCGLPNKNDDHHYLAPDLDILWSTETMKLHHYGCNANKTSKLKFLGNSKLAMENLRVCWVNKKREYNCCECEKCFRNMLGLYVTGALEKSKTFNKKMDLDKLRNTRVGDYCLKYYRAILDIMKLKNNQSEVRQALEDCINTNTHPTLKIRLSRNLRDSIRFFDQKYNRNRLYWFLSSKGLIK